MSIVVVLRAPFFSGVTVDSPKSVCWLVGKQCCGNQELAVKGNNGGSPQKAKHIQADEDVS